MAPLSRGRYIVGPAESEADILRVLGLRAAAFRGRGDPEADRDALDRYCRHMMVTEAAGGGLVGCFRLMTFADGRDLHRSYAAQWYDLAPLCDYAGPMAELGRFCVAPGRTDPDILRLAWGAMARIVTEAKIGLLFGCASFPGTDPRAFSDAFAVLRDRHLAPDRFRPGIKARQVVRFARVLPGAAPDPLRAARAMPPLLRTYLLMGGWVSDHAVIDADLGTLHVFTGVEIDKVPQGRARLLHALAG